LLASESEQAVREAEAAAERGCHGRRRDDFDRDNDGAGHFEMSNDVGHKDDKARDERDRALTMLACSFET
jgi:hypothetical protein